MEKPLSGVRIIDLTIYLSGPYCTQILASLGAEVIKIERPGVGDLSRDTPPFASKKGVHGEKVTEHDISFSILKRNRNKKSITLNFGTDEGKEIYKRLVKNANVVVENFRPGVMKRKGLDYEALKKINPSLIYCAISGFGQEGKNKNLAAFDIIAQAYSGLMACTGFQGHFPTRSALAIGDLAAALYGAIAVVAAVRYCDQTGKGQMIDISMIDSVVSLLLDEPWDYNLRHGIPVPNGNAIHRLTPFNSYKAKDGYIVVGAPSDENWVTLLKVMGREDLIGDQRYNILERRALNSAEIEEIVSNWVAKLGRKEAVQLLQDAGLPASLVRYISEVLEDEELAERGMISEIIHPQGPIEGYRAANSPMNFSESPAELNEPAPYLGAHNEEIYGRLLGFSPEEIQKLKEKEII
ncbi:MAG: CaiB/BaiF CoA transferase family protein [Dethiobacteria bacterium]|jgi:crotonobetainyl-CoA:carnitine CoA-transferase CaiB-like acyl-CoA transferase